MIAFYIAVCVVLCACLLFGLIRVLSGPDNANRMLAAQLFGTISVTITLLLSFIQGSSVLIDVALVICLLASITVVAFLKLAEANHQPHEASNHHMEAQHDHDNA